VKPYTLHLGDCLDVLRGMATTKQIFAIERHLEIAWPKK
jgi:hypothetical protein